MKNDFLVAITQISAERHLPKEVVLEAIEQALVLAYKRGFGAAQNVEVRIDPNTGKARVFVELEVVEEVRDKRSQTSLEEARQTDAAAHLGGVVKVEVTPKDFGRIAIQTAKQVIQQRIREAERDTLYADWSDRLGELVLGTVRNLDATGNVILSLGRAEAVMPKSEQIPTEQYTRGEKLRSYIYEVEKTSRGPRIRISRTHRKLLRRLFESEIPEIYNGAVEIKAIAREPGSRSKVAVAATQPGVDPIGSCVGMRGVRIQSVVNELNGEKIDVVAWSNDERQFVANSLSPAKVEHVWLDEASKTATVVVPDNQLSLAIGKEGQNARLAAKLTNWRIDIKSLSESAEEAERRAKEEVEVKAREAELAAKRKAALALLAEAERALAEEARAAEAAAAEAALIVEAVAQPEVAAPVGAVPAVEAAEAVPEPAAAEELKPAPTEAAAPGEAPQEAPAEGALQPAVAGAEGPPPEFVDEDQELDAEDRADTPKGQKAKRRRKYVYEYDEKSGTVVRRTQHKASRTPGSWEDQTEQ